MIELTEANAAQVTVMPQCEMSRSRGMLHKSRWPNKF